MRAKGEKRAQIFVEITRRAAGPKTQLQVEFLGPYK